MIDQSEILERMQEAMEEIELGNQTVHILHALRSKKLNVVEENDE